MYKIIITAVVVIVFGTLVWSHLGVSEDGIIDESYAGSFVGDTDNWVEYVSDDIEIAEKLTEPSFDEAFKTARETLGPGGTFLWIGNEYTTDYLEEVTNDSEFKSYDSNIVDVITPAVEDSLSSLITPEQ